MRSWIAKQITVGGLPDLEQTGAHNYNADFVEYT